MFHFPQPIRMGISAAASWAWGTSLIVGMQIAQQKGLSAWFIWAIANSLTLAFFGMLARQGILGRHIFNKKPIKVAALCIQCLCLVIQMNIIYEVLCGFGMAMEHAYMVASTVGVVFTVWMYWHGLRTSIATDVWQGCIAVIAILVILAIGLSTGAQLRVFPVSTSGDILWGIWSACILLSGPIGDVQHWQRAEVAGDSPAYYWGAVFFALYMALILAMACFKFSMTMNGVLLIAVLCVTSSTIDSIAVALHEVANKRIGTGVSLAICISWGVFANIGVLSLWSHAGAFRVAFAIAILLMAAMSARAAKRQSLL